VDQSTAQEEVTLSRLRITVLKKMHFPDLQASYAKDGTFGICTAFEEGQIFETTESKPDGFCSWAWADIQRDVTLVRSGAELPWIGPKNTMISSCTDGFRPVVFRIDRIDHEEP
jgi:uncharacterized repeat protein (TIGR04076 family)